jgi:hypothetical protein
MDWILLAPQGVSVLAAERDAQARVENLELEIVGEQEVLEMTSDVVRGGCRGWGEREIKRKIPSRRSSFTILIGAPVGVGDE